MTQTRRPVASEIPAMVRTFADVMNQVMSDEDVGHDGELIELDRSWLVADDTDGDAIVATVTGHTMEITVPGDRLLSMGGLTLVSVRPTHRRRGLMTGLISRFFDDCVARAEPIAGLVASEASIYGRYGFGSASWFHHVSIARHPSVPMPRGKVVLRSFADSADQLEAIFVRTRGTRTGDVQRTAPMWRGLRGRLDKAGAGKAVWTAVHLDAGGAPDGYVVYRIENRWVDHTAQNVAHVLELVGDETTRVDLWLFLLGLDLVGTVVDYHARPDEPIRHALPDPRLLRTLGVNDQLWLCVLDVAGALQGRAYRADGRLVFSVEEPAQPSAVGTYELVVEGGTGRVTRSSDTAELTLTGAALASTYLGGQSVAGLVGSGQVTVHTPGADWRLDALLATGRCPQNLFEF